MARSYRNLKRFVPRPMRFESLESRAVFAADTDVTVFELPDYLRPPPQISGPDSSEWRDSADLSGDGRFVMFESSAEDLVAGDNNGARDIFLKDFGTGTTTLLSVTSSGAAANGDSFQPNISADGRYVSFISRANLTTNDINAYADIYVKDLATGTLECVTAARNWVWGYYSATLSADGRHLAYSLGESPFNAFADLAYIDSVWVVNLETHQTDLLRNAYLAPRVQYANWLQVDGRTVFSPTSAAPTIQTYDSAADAARALDAGAANRAPVAVSPDGRIVASIASGASQYDLVGGELRQIYAHDVVTGATRTVSSYSYGDPVTTDSYLPSASADGNQVAFFTDYPEGRSTLIVKDLTTELGTGVAVVATSDRIEARLSADGRYVVLAGGGRQSSGEEVAGDIYRFEVNPQPPDSTCGLMRALIGEEWYRTCDPEAVDDNQNFILGPRASSNDGRYVLFESSSPNLVAGDTNEARDIFLRDMTTGEIQRLSLSADGLQANGASYDASLSDDGRYLCFVSRADNLVPGDTNRNSDIFVKDLQTGTIVRLTRDDDWLDKTARISADGSHVVFTSTHQSNFSWRNLDLGYDPAPSPGFVVNVATGERTRIEQAQYAFESQFAISGNARVLALVRSFELHLIDLTTGEDRVIVPQRGSAWLGRDAFSADGRYLAFSARLDAEFKPDETDPYHDIYVYDLLTDTFRTVSTGPALAWDSRYASISSDGSRVAYMTENGDQESDGFRIVVQDVRTGEILPLATDASEPFGGYEGGPPSLNLRISANGAYVFAVAVHPELAEDRVAGRVVRFAVDSGTPAALTTPIRGDTDRSGAIDPSDLAWSISLVNQYMGPIHAAPAKASWLTVDLNGDGSFDTSDVLLTLIEVNKALMPRLVNPDDLSPPQPTADDSLAAAILGYSADLAKKKSKEAAGAAVD